MDVCYFVKMVAYFVYICHFVIHFSCVVTVSKCFLSVGSAGFAEKNTVFSSV